MSKRPVILTFLSHYLPGYLWGGPVRAVDNLVHHLGDEFDFRIVCKDRDVLDSEPYPGIVPDQWNRVGKAQVYYMSPRSLHWRGFYKILKETDHDVLYLNSFFDRQFSILPLVLRRVLKVKKVPIVLASRGEFTYGGLNIKPLKKKVYLWLVKRIGLLQEILWQASTCREVKEIRRIIGVGPDRIIEAIELPPPPREIPAGTDSGSADSDLLRVLYLSRISHDKNFEYAVRVLAKVGVPVEFNIYGPICDANYWKRCKEVIDTFPPHIRVSYHGPVAHTEVLPIYARHDLFFLPTFGENYCYVIAESLSVGTPVLIANTSLWRHLDSFGAGWDLPLEAPEEFVKRIEFLASLPSIERRKYRDQARKYYAQMQHLEQSIRNNRNLFLKAL